MESLKWDFGHMKCKKFAFENSANRKSQKLQLETADNTYKLPANPAALFSIMVGSGGLHMIMSSWSDCMTTPGNCGNHTRTWTNP